jgi:hypothetical protein
VLAVAAGAVAVLAVLAWVAVRARGGRRASS